MMTDKEVLDGTPAILQTIGTLAANSETGRLDIFAGAIEGALLFKNGKLVDARVGHLTGFQAVNALASMRDARFHFDPSVAVPSFSPITSSERHVLKQFFGIETYEANDDAAAPVTADEVDEATVIKSDVTSAPIEPLPVPPRARSRAPYLIAFAVSVLIVALATAAVFLRSRYREVIAPAQVATNPESVSAPAPAPASVSPAPASVSSAPAPVSAPTETTVSETTTPPARDLTGKWNVVNTVHTTGYKSFQNLQIGFAVSINQTGRTFTAQGQKISENGRSLPASSRTPIQLQGTIDGDKIEATFFEQGTLRKTSGRFVWKIDPASGALTGTFASTAARTSGKSTARRDL